ncbi:MAG: ubiquitin-conjugating enzyme E2 [Candidatus Micrarchaeota archaeon]
MELPLEIYKRRLESEYSQMASSSYKFDVNADKSKYVVSLHGPGVFKQGNNVFKRESHSIEIDLKRSYPYPGGVMVYWLTPIFHPNVHPEEGIVCIQLVNDWAESQTVLSIVKALEHLLVHPNPKDPLNKEAAKFFEENPKILEGVIETKPKKPRIIQ